MLFENLYVIGQEHHSSGIKNTQVMSASQKKCLSWVMLYGVVSIKQCEITQVRKFLICKKQGHSSNIDSEDDNLHVMFWNNI